MKKIMVFIITVIFVTMFLCGCNGDEDSRRGLIGSDSDLYGTWSASAGSFTAGDSIRFNADGTYDLFWSHSGYVLFNGTWDKTINSTSGAYILVLTIGDKVTTYYYYFFDDYNTLRLREEDGSSYIYYYKQ